MTRIGILLAGLALSACAHASAGPEPPKGRIAARFLTLDGQGATLAAHRGKVVLLTVMTTWSDFALLEVPRLKALHVEHAPDLQIICVALDEDPAMVRIFVETFDVPYEVVRAHDPARFTGPNGPLGPIGVIPTSVLLDRRGHIAARMDGVWAPAVLHRAVESLLADREVAPDRGIQ